MNAPLRPLLLPWTLLAVLVASLTVGMVAITIHGTQGKPRLFGQARASGPACPGDRPCAELVELEVRDVISLEEVRTHAVVLMTRDHDQVLPIFVDENAAIAIALRLAHRPSPRPQALDLLGSMLSQIGARLTEVHLESADGAALDGKVLITVGDRRLELKARPSDSIALALAHGGKIFATREVLASGGLTRAEIDLLKRQPAPPPDDGADPGTGGSGPSDPAEEPPDRRGAQELNSGGNEPIRL